jgi:hypothetical protein
MGEIFENTPLSPLSFNKEALFTMEGSKAALFSWADYFRNEVFCALRNVRVLSPSDFKSVCLGSSTP